MIELDSRLIKNKKLNDEVAISGNASIARGIMESSIKIVTSYPGTPCAEIVEHLILVSDDSDFYLEWSINEKVALEVAAGAAMSGVRSAFITKHVGMNVASDSLIHICYAGVNAGMVIISADDPGAFDSPIEEDTRFYARMAEIIGIEPSDQQEAKDMVINAIELSEKIKLPVFIRVTNRILYGRGKVILGEIRHMTHHAKFVREDLRWFIAGRNAVKRHQWLHMQQDQLKSIAEESRFNKIEWAPLKKYGIITTGVCYQYAREAIKDLPIRDNFSILKIGYFNPLPENYIKKFLMEVDEVLIIEELEPFIEEKIKGIAFGIDKKIKIYGKLTHHFPETDALSTELVKEAIEKLWLDRTEVIPVNQSIKKQLEDLNNRLPKQADTFCPGCPHRASLFVLKQSIRTIKQEFIVTNDIGCYLLGIRPPFSLTYTVFCMGASIGIGSGLYQAKVSQRIVAIIGDSTFLHAGVPALINCCYSNVDIFIYIMDNRTIAMTGLQPHPGIGIDVKGKRTKAVNLEDIVKACNVDYLAVIDPFKINKAKRILCKALAMKGQRVVIARHECAQLIRKISKKENKNIKTYKIDYRKCKKCKKCLLVLGCPAILVRNKDVIINKLLCSGCGFCIQVCPYRAIEIDKYK